MFLSFSTPRTEKSSEIASSPHRTGFGKNLLAKKVTEDYTYIGHFLNGNMNDGFHGNGLLINRKPHEYIYDGNYLNGERDGNGLLIDFKNDYFYDGVWKKSKMHGFGKLKLKITTKGEYYEGHFKDNKKDGLVSSKV